MNNLDMSSSGENITLNVYYDSDLSHFYYQDFINGADGNAVYKVESSREVLAYLIGDSDKPYYKKSALSKMKKAQLFDLWQDYDLGYNDDCNKAEYISDLLNVTIARYYDYVFTQLQSRYIDENIKHNYFISCGYSQGDSVYIVDIGADYEVVKYPQSINHILWDTPIRIDLSINDDDEFGYDLLRDEYEYDEATIIKNVNKLDISDYAKNWIAENLPGEPSYG